jgi:hypothetical protein
MLYREIIAVCSQIHTKHINTLCGQNVELLNVKLAVHISTSTLCSQLPAAPRLTTAALYPALLCTLPPHGAGSITYKVMPAAYLAAHLDIT